MLFKKLVLNKNMFLNQIPRFFLCWLWKDRLIGGFHTVHSPNAK